MRHGGLSCVHFCTKFSLVFGAVFSRVLHTTCSAQKYSLRQALRGWKALYIKELHASIGGAGFGFFHNLASAASGVRKTTPSANIPREGGQ